MTAPLKRCIVRSPTEAFGNADPIVWHYTSKIDLAGAKRDHEDLCNTLRSEGVELLYHSADLPSLADSIFVHDPVLITNSGYIQLRMGKQLRRGEEAAIAAFLSSLSIPKLGEITAPGTVEGGDLLWIDEQSLAVGRGFRTNASGIAQLSSILQSIKIELVQVDLPYWEGPQSCLHLQSLISLVDTRTAAVYMPLLTVSLVEQLTARGYKLLQIPESEKAFGPNILAIKPKLVLVIDGNDQTRRLLEAHGIRVLTYNGGVISLKAEGGPTCLTRPLLRC